VLGVSLAPPTAADVAEGVAPTYGTATYRLHLDPAVPAGAVPGFNGHEYYDYVVVAAPCPEGLEPRLRVEGDRFEANTAGANPHPNPNLNRNLNPNPNPNPNPKPKANSYPHPIQATTTDAENMLARCKPVAYQHVHVTLVYGLLDPAYLFGGDQGGVGSGPLSVAELNGKISDVRTLTLSLSLALTLTLALTRRDLRRARCGWRRSALQLDWQGGYSRYHARARDRRPLLWQSRARVRGHSIPRWYTGRCAAAAVEVLLARAARRCRSGQGPPLPHRVYRALPHSLSRPASYCSSRSR
jgi:hypothetical protein